MPYCGRERLLPRPLRRPYGYREYRASDVGRLRFVQRAKELGFTLSELAELLSLTADRRSDMQGVKRKAQERLAQVEAKIAELRRVKHGPTELIGACPSHGQVDRNTTALT